MVGIAIPLSMLVGDGAMSFVYVRHRVSKLAQGMLLRVLCATP